MNKVKNVLLALVPVAMVSGLFVAIVEVAVEGQEPAAASVDRAAFARGAKAWVENCGRCHNIRAASELTDEEWEVSVTHMRVRANISGDIARDIIEFLKASN